MGNFRISATTKRRPAAIKIRTAKKIKGSAKGKPYFAPTKPVLQRATKRAGANLEKLRLRKSPSTALKT